MHHDFAMGYLIEQRSEQLIEASGQRHRATARSLTRSGLLPRLGRGIAARLPALMSTHSRRRRLARRIDV
jgi:hypothetical protein